jgi:hypothetical protein
MSVAIFRAHFGPNSKLLLVKNFSAQRTSSYRYIRNASISYKVLKTLGVNFEYLEPKEILSFIENNSNNYFYELPVLKEFDYLNYKNRKQKLQLKGVVSTGADSLFVLLRFYEVQLDINFIKEWILWKKFAYQFNIKTFYFPGFGSKYLSSKRNFVFVDQELLLKQITEILNSNSLELSLKTIEEFDIVVSLDSLNYVYLISYLKVKISEFLIANGKLPVVLVKPHPNLSFDLKALNDFEKLIELKTSNSFLNLDLDKLTGIPLEFILVSKKVNYIGPWSSALNNIQKSKCSIVSATQNKSLIDRSYLVYRRMLARSWGGDN